MKHYRAPWSATLLVVSSVASLLCLGLGLRGWRDLAEADLGSLDFWFSLLPIALLVGAALFTVRGYSIKSDAILVHRLLWNTTLPREELESARSEPAAFRDTIRTFGNGGFFSFSGWYQNSILGPFQAFATDNKRAVVLRYPHRTIVLTPDQPESFVGELARQT